MRLITTAEESPQMKRYRITNWPEYNRSLVQRGNINIWFSEDAIRNWRSSRNSGDKGRPQEYSDDAILCALIIRTVYHLPLRALEGLLNSIVQMLKLSIKVPSYTQICRRAKALGKKLKRLTNRRPCDIVFDSTGLKVYGEGEWKVRQHGVSKRRTWKKLHLGVDPDSKEIVVAELTCNGAGSGDGEVGRRLMRKIPKGVQRVFGDGAYDGTGFRQAVEQIGAEAIVPPPRDAIAHFDTEDAAILKRNHAVCEIKGLGGDDQARKIWKVIKEYHRRSLAETTMYRIKQLTGEKLRSRELERQKVEGYIKCMVVNQMTRLGMPVSIWEEAA
jgi:hypothetical protein